MHKNDKASQSFVPVTMSYLSKKEDIPNLKSQEGKEFATFAVQNFIFKQRKTHVGACASFA